jgi:hypothetical protein
MLNYQLLRVKESLDKVSDYEGVEFAYAVFKNKKLIEEKLREFQFIGIVKPEIIEYENKRINICKELSKKDEHGVPIIDQDNFVIDEPNMESFQTKLTELYNEYKIVVDERRDQIKNFDKLMNEETDVQFVKIQRKDISPQLKTANELEELSFMIE